MGKVDKKMLLFISGSYPENQEGIASGAKVLLDAMAQVIGKDRIILLTTDTPIVSNNIKKNSVVEYRMINNWRVSRNNIKKITSILDTYPISSVHIEYPGDLYGKTLLASFLPWIIHRYNKKSGRRITVNVRLHEFTRARLIRKIAIIPLLCADRIYVPGQRDRKLIKRIAGDRVEKTLIGTNIMVVPREEVKNKANNKQVISYFGAVYPGKGIERMLAIWKKIKDEDLDEKFVFKIIGGLGKERDYHKNIWKQIENYGLQDVIEVTGFLSDNEVSKELQDSSMATLLYEDGLTLRRGSFLAYLVHGIPIITSSGDDESMEMFSHHPGITMAETDSEIIEAINVYSNLSPDEREEIRRDNTILSRTFDWDSIAKTFIKDYQL